MYRSCCSSIHHGSQFIPEGYFFICSAGKVFAAPYSKTFIPTTQNWHYTRIGNYQETGETCS
ncbi:hypothetical protein PDN70_30530 [Bacillus cereus]|nr:hypothetical protein [Bacillus cereus]